MRKCAAGLLFVVCALAASAEDRPIITVMDLTVDQISEAQMRTVISLLSSSLFKTDRYTVIDVSERDSLLKEIEFSAQDCTDENCQLEIGKLLAAEYIVVGRIGLLGKKYVLSVKLLQTATSRTASTADGMYDSIEEMATDLDSIANRIAGLSGEKSGTSTAKAAPRERRPVDLRRVAAFGSAAGGVAGLGLGAYLVVNAVSYFNGPVEDAFTAYLTEPQGSPDIGALYEAYLSEFGSYGRKMIPGVVCAGAGVALGITAVFLFVLPPATALAPAVSLGFGPDGLSLGLRVAL